MRAKEVKINIPEGYEIDKDNSTFECIKFKKKDEGINTWKDLQRVSGYYINTCSSLSFVYGEHTNSSNKNVFHSKKIC